MRHVDEQHEKMLALARERGVLSLTIDAGRTAPLFSGDRIHLNNAGHAFVAAQVLHMFRAVSPSPERHPKAASPDMGVSCHMGKNLQAAVIGSRGFVEADFASRRAGAPKVGLEAREAGAALTLCAQLRPPGGAKPHGQGAKSDPPQWTHRIAVGLQTAHARVRPLFGRARVSCHGPCRCSCKWSSDCLFDGLSARGVSVTRFVQLDVSRTAYESPEATDADARSCSECAVRITSVRGNETEEAQLPRHRVGVRAMIVGARDWRTWWTNDYMLGRSGLMEGRVDR